jgi:hypothetical protein
MKLPRRQLQPLLFIFVIGGVSGQALACPDHLKALQSEYLGKESVCSIFDRYHKALSQLRERKLSPPERVGNLMAPRFINLPDWLKKRSSNANSAPKIYKPAPETWKSWEAGAQIISESAKSNFQSRTFKPIDLEWLKTLHATSMHGLLETAGRFRTGVEVGMALNLGRALTIAQVVGARSVEYPALLKDSAKLVNFHSTRCLEHQPEAFQKEYNQRPTKYFSFSEWPDIGSTHFFTTSEGIQKQCGYLIYSPIEEVAPQMESWLKFVNTSAQAAIQAQPAGDAIFIAARAQRWFIAIHPYEKGNGRMSRFVMDLLLTGLGLPAPILKNMDEDMYVAETQWAKEVGNGIRRALRAAELCVQNSSSVGCAVISQSQVGVLP